MPLFLETIRVDEGVPCQLELHQRRVEETLRAFYPFAHISLLDFLPRVDGTNRAKWRIVYDYKVREVSLTPYIPRPIASLCVIETEEEYEYKSAERQWIDEAFAQRGEADDVLFVRDGLITDTSICNVALFDGEDWLTPAQPLLKGTMRRSLLQAGVLKEAPIAVANLFSYSKIRLFNALLPWGEVEITDLRNRLHFL